MSDEKVHYRAKSFASSTTIIFNVLAVVGTILALPEVLAIIPATALPIIAVLTPLINVFLRFKTVRPIAAVMPGESVPVAVEKL